MVTTIISDNNSVAGEAVDYVRCKIPILVNIDRIILCKFQSPNFKPNNCELLTLMVITILQLDLSVQRPK